MFNVEGELSNEWTYSLDYQNSKTKIDFSYLNDISKSRAAQALNVTGTALNPLALQEITANHGIYSL